VVSLVAFFNDIWAWHEERRAQLRRRTEDMPKLSQFTDSRADALVLATRMIIGALTGYLVHNEVTGVIPVIAAGASAHAILSQFGKNPAYSPSLEVGTDPGATSGPADGTASNTGPHEVGAYRARHAKGDQYPGVVPRQRVQPDRSRSPMGSLSDEDSKTQP
jgi:hypothetical protein